MHSSSFSIYNYIRVIVLYIEAEVGYVAVFHDIVLTFQANEAFFFGCILAAASDEVIIGYDFGTNEAFFDIAVNFTGCLRCFGTFYDGPSASFHFTGSEEVDKTQQGIASFDKFVQAAFGNA